MKDRDVLEHRYRRLLRAYPRSWRARREDEMAATYLEAAPEGRRRPGFRDAYDVLRAALRERLRVSAEAGLSAGSRLAAEWALVAASALAAFWFCRVELSPVPDWFTGREVPAFTPDAELQVHDVFGPVQSIGAFAWIAWLLTALAASVLSGRWLRRAVAVALAVSVLVVPATLLLPYFRMPLHILIPQLALGAVALRVDAGRRGFVARFAPLAAVLAVAVPVLADEPWNAPGMYITLDTSGTLKLAAGGLLVLGALCIAVMRRRSAGLWAMLLTVPAALVLASVGSLRDGGAGPDVMLRGATAIATAVAGGGVLLGFAVWLQNRYQRTEPPTEVGA